MSAMGVYLKYFHGGAKSIEELLEQVDEVNKGSEEGTVKDNTINSLHVDNKVDGGIESTLSIGFTSKSYKSAKKGKSKGKLYEKSVTIHQSKYTSTGNAWKVWDSSTVLSRWCYEHKELFKDKTIHEVGSGCGLVGILLSYFCKGVTMSDYKEEILNNIRRNVDLNQEAKDIGNITVELLDFQQIYEGSSVVPQEKKVDFVLGSDVIYGTHLSTWLPHTVNQLLKEDGTFYLVNPKNRVGVDEFIENMEKFGFHCRVQTVSDDLCNDFVKKPCWDIITCSRLPLSSLEAAKEDSSDDELVDLENSFFHHKELKKTMLTKEE